MDYPFITTLPVASCADDNAYPEAVDCAATWAPCGVVDAAAYLSPDPEWSASPVVLGCEVSSYDSSAGFTSPGSWGAQQISSSHVYRTGLESLRVSPKIQSLHNAPDYSTTSLSAEDALDYYATFSSRATYISRHHAPAVPFGYEFTRNYAHEMAIQCKSPQERTSKPASVDLHSCTFSQDAMPIATVQHELLWFSITPAILSYTPLHLSPSPQSPFIMPSASSASPSAVSNAISESHGSDSHEFPPARDRAKRAECEARYKPYTLLSRSSKTGNATATGTRKSAVDRQEAPSRHFQVKQDDGQDVLLPPTDSLQCSICSYEQINDRRPDLIRHVLTHYPKKFRCGGIPVELAQALGVTEWRRETEWTWGATTYVGGCLHGFSRRDALGRHLSNEKGCCFGSSYAPYNPALKRISKKAAKDFAVVGWFGGLRVI